MNKASKVSALFGFIEQLQGERPWGRVLDVGTGVKSAKWLSRIDCEAWTAVTASNAMARKVAEAEGVRSREQDRLLVGNWADERLLAGERFDTVLMDYFIGAVDGFTPYWQEQAFDRIRPHVCGRLYFIGLEPYVPFRAESEAGRIICEIGRLRDACLLLAGERPYREFPLLWVLGQLERTGFRIVQTRCFAIRYRERFVNSQLDMCIRRLDRFEDDSLAAALRGRVEALRDRALSYLQTEDGLRHGHDYVIAAEPRD